MERIKTWIIIILAVVVAGFVVFTAFGTESGARRIVDLENTNTQLRDGAAKDRETIERLARQNESQQRDYEQRIDSIIESIGAQGNYNRDAIKTVDKLIKISERIGN